MFDDKLCMFIEVLFPIVSYECFEFWKLSNILVARLIVLDCEFDGKLHNWLNLGKTSYLISVF